MPVKRSVALLCCFVFSAVVNAQTTNNDFSNYEQKLPGSSLQFKMVPIKSGHFMMGSPAAEKDRLPNEGPQRNISIDAFWMSANEVTRDAFDVFLKDESTSQNSEVDAITRPSPQYVDLSWGMGKQGGFPANSMSQFAAIMYCRWLYQKTAIFYRLPSEAEWEYACRAGTNTVYYFGNDASKLGDYAWYSENSNDKFQKVGQKLPNAWGLYDMLGNVMEWTLDHYTDNYYGGMADNNPMAAPNASHYPKSIRGGGFTDDAMGLRSAKRTKSDPVWNRRDPQIPRSKWWLTDARALGFRIIRPLQQPTKEQAEQFFIKYLGQ